MASITRPGSASPTKHELNTRRLNLEAEVKSLETEIKSIDVSKRLLEREIKDVEEGKRRLRELSSDPIYLFEEGLDESDLELSIKEKTQKLSHLSDKLLSFNSERHELEKNLKSTKGKLRHWILSHELAEAPARAEERLANTVKIGLPLAAGIMAATIPVIVDNYVNGVTPDPTFVLTAKLGLISLAAGVLYFMPNLFVDIFDDWEYKNKPNRAKSWNSQWGGFIRTFHIVIIILQYGAIIRGYYLIHELILNI